MQRETTAPAATIGGARPMAIGADGAIWVGTTSPALLRIDPTSATTVSHALSFTPHVVASGDGRIYALGNGYIAEFP